MTILVTAAFGNQGRMLIPRLAARGLAVRALRHSAEGEAELRALGANEVVLGDMADPIVRARALEGVDAVYHVGPSAHPAERAMGLGMVRDAVAAGVRHFVLSSVLYPGLRAMGHHALKLDIEEALIESGLNFTILRPADYMQVVLYREALATGIYRRWWNVDRKEALVDLADVAEVAAKVLGEGAPHFGATYELCSGENPTGPEIAAAIARAAGRPIALAEVSAEDFLRAFFGAAYDDPAFGYTLGVLKGLNAWYGAHDFIGNAAVLRMLLGREPSGLETVVRRAIEGEDR